jgi:hypothetical protein
VILYRSGYKYQLAADYRVPLAALGSLNIVTEFITVQDGGLEIRKGYAWDGPSGPTIDTANFMRGALVHDALYQLIRAGMLGKRWRKFADITLRNICREDGMSAIRAWYVYRSVRAAGAAAASPKNKKRVHTAP